MKTIAELAAEGYRGKALSDALYEDMFGHPPPASEPTPEERQESWKKFFALMDTFTDEELNDGFMDHRRRSDDLDVHRDPDESAA